MNLNLHSEDKAKGHFTHAFMKNMVQNHDIAAIFDEVADLLEIAAANPFRVRAYRNAAQLIDSLPQIVAEQLQQGLELTDLPGIGADLAEKIKEIVATGKLKFLAQLQRRTPPLLTELLRIPGLGAKRVKRLRDSLHLENLDDLQKAVASGAILKIHGFGKKLSAQIAKGIAQLRSPEQRRSRWIDIEPEAEELTAYLRHAAEVESVTAAGSFRRHKETVNDLDLVVAAKRAKMVMKRFLAYPKIAETLAHGRTRATVKLRGGLQIDLRVVAPASYGAALLYLTGSKAHNIALRRRAIGRGLKINEYGVFQGKQVRAGKSEAEMYAAIGLPYIEPELRENRGEIEAAAAGQLPQLITYKDIRGDLHSHTNDTDGADTLDDMAAAAMRLGYEYLAITDHSSSVRVAHGLDEKRLLKQLDVIDRWNEQHHGLRLLKGIEVDIRRDGTLDLPNSVLARLDLRVCAVHYHQNLNFAQMTQRLLRAMDNPYFNILAHPTGRLLTMRQPYAFDMEKILMAAKERGCSIEVNAQPSRLDLNDIYCKTAKEIGVRLVISTDAHSTANLQLMRLGIAQARRGWLAAANVLNTLPLAQLLAALQR